MKLKNKQNRLQLTEGRSYQMGFAFCKKINDELFETIQPISPCKDYLNDVIYSEITGNPIKVYGADIVKNNIFREDFAYLAFEIVPSFDAVKLGKVHSEIYTEKQYNEDKVNLASNIKEVEKVVNFVESQFKLSTFTKIQVLENNQYIAIIPIFWTTRTYLISLYSLLLRVGQYSDGTKSVEEFLNTYNKPLDQSRWAGALPAYKWLIQNNLLPEDLNNSYKEGGAYGVHNLGICSIKNPETGKVFSSKW